MEHGKVIGGTETGTGCVNGYLFEYIFIFINVFIHPLTLFDFYGSWKNCVKRIKSFYYLDTFPHTKSDRLSGFKIQLKKLMLKDVWIFR